LVCFDIIEGADWKYLFKYRYTVTNNSILGYVLPREYELIYCATEQFVARVSQLENWWAKGAGAIGLPDLPAERGIWLTGVASVHTCFVRFSLDLVFLDKEFCTLRCMENVRPWRPFIWVPGAYHTLELGDGTLSNSNCRPQSGDCWRLQPIPSN
jgi:uncharacterized protein